MSNIKLSGHTWDTSGIYDAEQEKTQKQVNADVSEVKTAFTQIAGHSIPIDLTTANVRNGAVNINSKWSYSSSIGQKSFYFDDITPLYRKLIVTTPNDHGTSVCLLKNGTLSNQVTPNFCDGIDGRIAITAGTTLEIDIPTDCKYITITKSYSSDLTPSSVTFYLLKDIPTIDDTLTVHGDAADAKAVGDRFNDIVATQKTESITLNSGGDYLAASNEVGGTATLRTGSDKGVNKTIDISFARGGNIKLSTPSLVSNEQIVSLFCDENNKIIRRFVTSNRMEFDGENYSVLSSPITEDIKYLMYSAYKGSSTSLTVEMIKGDIARDKICYVSASGDDAGYGTQGSPFATIAKAITYGAKIINILSDLKQSFTSTNRNITINGNGYTIYGDEVLATESSGSILRAAYTADSRITACFVDKTTDLTETVSGSEWKGDKYNIACYADDQKLLPVEDIATCEATENSFTWDDGYFYINASGTRYSYVTASKIAVISGGKCVFNNLSMKHCYSNIIDISDAADVEINGCKAIGSINNNCITAENSNLVCRNVETSLCWNDGINTHGKGNSVLIDCYCHDCSDDGVSQHNNTTGVVMGGEFANCGKGGVASPINAAKVDVYNAYCHDNDYGIYAVASDSTPQTFNIFGCVVKDNRVGVNISGHTARMYNNKVSGNTTNTKTESGGSIVDLDT